MTATLIRTRLPLDDPPLPVSLVKGWPYPIARLPRCCPECARLDERADAHIFTKDPR